MTAASAVLPLTFGEPVPDNHGKIAVMGAGAVGCYYGGMLARAGEDVTFIGRPSHIDAINRDGLLLETRDFNERIAASASTDAAAVAGTRLVLFCVKSTATDEAARAIAPHLAPDALVLGLQNGVDNFERLQRTTDKAVIPAVVYVAAAMAGAGHVRHNGRGVNFGSANDSSRLPSGFNRSKPSNDPITNFPFACLAMEVTLTKN